jgi:H+/Cl- antiporter ClcA
MSFPITASKLKAVSTSTNLGYTLVAIFVSITTVLFTQPIDPTDLNALVKAITMKDFGSIIVIGAGVLWMLYNYFKVNKATGKFGDVWEQSNFKAALVMLISGLYSLFGPGEFPAAEAEALYDAILSKNVTLIIGAAWAFGNSMYQLLKKQPEEGAPA